MKTLIVNFGGLGDGFIELPFLNAIEKKYTDFEFYHTEGLLFSDKEFLKKVSLNSFLGTVPGVWRKFEEPIWSDIFDFIDESKIENIINFRNLGPLHDKSYFSFKEESLHRGLNLKFYDLFANNISIDDSKNIRFYLEQCLGSIISGSEIDYTFMSNVYQHTHEEKKIGINIHTGDYTKRWSIDCWIDLCSEILRLGYSLRIFTGISDLEIQESSNLLEVLNKNNPDHSKEIELVSYKSLMELIPRVLQLSSLVSVDSGLVHIASQLKVPAIGIYNVTSSVLWGGFNKFFYPVQSSHTQNCKNYSSSLGICKNKRELCEGVVSTNFDVPQMEIIAKLL